MKNPFKVISEERKQRRLEEQQYAFEDSNRAQEENDRLQKAIEAEEIQIEEQRKAKKENEKEGFFDKINPIKKSKKKKEDQQEHDARINNVVAGMKNQFVRERQEIYSKRAKIRADRQGEYKKSVAVIVVASVILLVAIVTTITIVGVNVYNENEKERQEALMAEQENQEALNRLKQEELKKQQEEEQRKQAELVAKQQEEEQKRQAELAAKQQEEARKAEEARAQAQVQEQQQASAQPSSTNDNVSSEYVLNKSSKVFHKPGCGSVSKMKDKNKEYFSGNRQDLINQGYNPCGNCHP